MTRTLSTLRSLNATRMQHLWRASSSALVDLLCPPECLWCNRPIGSTQSFCDACTEKLVSDYSRCLACAMPIPPVVPNQDCSRCRKAQWRFDGVLTLGPYRKELRDVVIAMKKSNQQILRAAMARLMHEELSRGLQHASKAVLVPVPNHWSHALSRVADVSGNLARRISKIGKIELATGTVHRIRKTDKQGMLPWSERTKNVRGAFEVRASHGLTGRHVILVDDVVTSGATASEVARVLKQAGIRRVTVLCAARGTGAKEVVTIERTAESQRDYHG